jgi:type III pantothenate kinase
MDLLIDIGNTNLRWATHDPEASAPDGEGPILGPIVGVRHHGALPIDLLAAWDQLDPPARVLVGNVGGDDQAEHLARATRSLWGREPLLAVTRGQALGVRVAYAEPTRLGVDRWLALIAAHHQGLGAALIVDAGTAITYDLMLADGRHLGGLILPGVYSMRETLLRRTRIPPAAQQGTQEAEPTAGSPPWATDTVSAIAAASLQAPAALAERLWRHLCDQVQGDRRLILTGGDAERLAPLIPGPVHIQPALVLQGLALTAPPLPE